MHSLGHPAAAAVVRAEDDTIPVLARWIGSWQISLRRRALSADALRHSYDRAAPGWGRTIDRLGVPHAYEAMLRRVLSEDAPVVRETQRRVLDCGVGTGALACALARVLPDPFRLDAIDISPGMLDLAGARFRDLGIAATLRQGDVCRLPYDDATFDLVLTGHVLEHLADPRAALAEMVRVLKPGGRLIACLTRRSVLGIYVQVKWRTHRVTPAEAEGWLRATGLQDVRCPPVDAHALSRQLSLACIGRKPF